MSNRRGEKKNPGGQEVKSFWLWRVNLTTGVSKQAYVLINRDRPEEISIPISDIPSLNTIRERSASIFSLRQEKSFSEKIC
jgi:hypothetical protein